MLPTALFRIGLTFSSAAYALEASKSIMATPQAPIVPVSSRILSTERPYIEDILDRYSSIPGITSLALGSSYWEPPVEALNQLVSGIHERNTQRYGSIEGLDNLKSTLRSCLTDRGLMMDNMDVVVTAGANQAFMNIALMLCDEKSSAVILSPYYFSHKLALQLAGATIHTCAFNPDNIKPDWNQLQEIFRMQKPKLVVVTNPNNPSGVVWEAEELQQLVDLCKSHDTWLIVDQTYHDFLFEGATHIYPCSNRFDYDKIIHLFSMSKAFGMPGWRVGYAAYPKQLTEQMRKIQDTIPTHTTILSQKLALHCLDFNAAHANSHGGQSWVQQTVSSMQAVRRELWPILEPLGTFPSTGAFYYLVPLPKEIDEEEAVHILAHQFKILLMPGSPFGAPGYLRLSYGSIPPTAAIGALTQLRDGFAHLQSLAISRRII